MFGAALFYGDGMITPAISVLSAVEGLEVATPRCSPISFRSRSSSWSGCSCSSSMGTAARRRAVRAGDGGVVRRAGAARRVNIVARAGVLAALNPLLRRRASSLQNRLAGFLTLGAVVLAVTGAEALMPTWVISASARFALAWFCVRVPGAGAELFRPGRVDSRRTRRRFSTRSSSSRRTGRSTRWWRLRRSPP